MIWFIEVVFKVGKNGKKFFDYLVSVNVDVNLGLMCLVFKFVIGVGKIIVMFMFIVW